MAVSDDRKAIREEVGVFMGPGEWTSVQPGIARTWKHGHDWWTTADVAAYLGIRESTVRAYAARGQMPPPDGRLGRTPWWRPATIKEWKTR